MIFYEYELPTIAPCHTLEAIDDRIECLREELGRLAYYSLSRPSAYRITMEIIETESLLLINMRKRVAKRLGERPLKE